MPPSQYLGCVPPWREASQNTGTQELSYEAPRIDPILSGYDPRRDMQYCHNVTFPPVTVSPVSFTRILSKLTDLFLQDGAAQHYGGSIPGPVAYHQGNPIWGGRNPHGPLFATVSVALGSSKPC